MPERFQSMRDRLRYPSSQDGKEVLRRLVPPSALLFLASSIKRVLPAESQAIAHLGVDQAEASDLAKKARLIAIPGFAAAGLIFIALSYQEAKNRVRYGEHLTVSKVAVSLGYFASKLFPEVAKERFVGEVHFKGKWKMRYSPQESAHSVMWKLFSDLYELAEAVENNDPRLKDLRYFIGLSSMVTPLLEKFGFIVVHYKDQIGLPALGQEQQGDLKLLVRPVMAAMISKEGLLEHKADFARFTHR